MKKEKGKKKKKKWKGKKEKYIYIFPFPDLFREKPASLALRAAFRNVRKLFSCFVITMNYIS